MTSRKLAVFFHHLQRERRRRQSQCRCCKPRRLPGRPKCNDADRAQKRRCQHDLCGAQPKDRLAHGPETSRPQLEPYQEKQEHDPEFGEVQNLLGVTLRKECANAKRTEQNTRYEIPKDGCYPEPARKGGGKRQGREQDRHFVERHVLTPIYAARSAAVESRLCRSIRLPISYE